MNKFSLTYKISGLVVLLLLSLLFVSVNQVLNMRTVVANIEVENKYRLYDAVLQKQWKYFQKKYDEAMVIGSKFTASGVELPVLEESIASVDDAFVQLNNAVLNITGPMVNEWASRVASTSDENINVMLESLLNDTENLHQAFEVITTVWREKQGFVFRKKAEKAVAAALTPLVERVGHVGSLYQDFVDIRSERNVKAANATVFQSIVIPAVIFVISIFLSLAILRNMKLELRSIVEVTHALAQGDLSRTINLNDNNDEINAVKKSVAAMSDKLNVVFGRVLNLTFKLDDSTKEQLGYDDKRIENTERQQQKMDGLSQSINELSQASEQVTENAALALEKADVANELAKEGRNIVTEAVSSMAKLAGDIEKSVAVIESLDSQAENITGILAVIKGIADQTNLLALNAAIEAARAGEQGRGFAVVADEVRNLAKRTQDSTEEIQSTLSVLKNSTVEAVSTIKESHELSTASAIVVEKAGGVIEKINDSIDEIKTFTTQTSDSSNQQTQTFSSILNNVNEVSAIAEDSTKGAQKSRESSSAMADLSAQLLASVDQFELKS